MINEIQMQGVLGAALGSGGDFAELFFEDCLENNLFAQNGSLNKAETVRICGAGVYVLRGTGSAYVYTNDLSYEGLLRAAAQAADLLGAAGLPGAAGAAGTAAGAPGSGGLAPLANGAPGRASFRRERYANPNPFRVRPSAVPGKERAALVLEAGQTARACCADLRQLEVAQFAREQHITVANSEGLYVEDERVTNRLRFTYVLERGGQRKSGWGDYTRPQGWEAYDCLEPVLGAVREMLSGAAASFDGRRVRACRVPVVMEAGVCGTLWHEACGHPLEASAISGHASEYEGLLGQRVGSEKVTLIDDGTIPGLYGSRSVDDEGHRTQRNVLIERGVLKRYLCDRLGGRKLGMASTGSGRRQGYMYAPVSRMSNTYLEVGEDAEADLLSSIDEGLYVKSFGGGSGGREFSLEVAEGYWIKNGELTVPVKGLMLTGKGPELLKNVDGVGGVQGYDGGGFCGAASGLCPVTSFQPRIRIREMSIGGEEA